MRDYDNCLIGFDQFFDLMKGKMTRNGAIQFESEEQSVSCMFKA